MNGKINAKILFTLGLGRSRHLPLIGKDTFQTVPILDFLSFVPFRRTGASGLIAAVPALQCVEKASALAARMVSFPFAERNTL